MQVIQGKMKKWLNAFKVLTLIGAIVMAICAGVLTLGCIGIASYKNIMNEAVDDGTLGELLADYDITSRWQIFWQLATITLFIIFLYVALLLAYKWLKKIAKSGEPFTKSSIEGMRKLSLFIYSACLVGFIIDFIVSLAIDLGTEIFSPDYLSLLLVGLAIHGLSYVFAYASAIRKDEFVSEEEKQSIQPANNDGHNETEQ